MRKWWEILLVSLLGAAVLGVLITGLEGSRRERAASKCSGIEITVLDSADHKFLSGKDVQYIIDRDFGGYVNRPRDSVSLRKVEKILSKQIFLSDAQAYFSPDAVLHIEVRQCKPLAKRTDQGNLLYMNAEGKFIKVSEDWCSELPEIEGTGKASEKWDRLFGKLALKIASDPLWKERVSLYRLYPNGEVGLELKDRQEEFILGQPTLIEAKLKRINKYETEIVPLSKDKNYNKITVKYRGQIVCI